MNQMTIEQFKEVAEYFPRGRILPNRIVKVVKGNKKQKHNFKSLGCYILIRKHRMWIIPEKDCQFSATMGNMRNVTVAYNPYGTFFMQIFCYKTYDCYKGLMPEL